MHDKKDITEHETSKEVFKMKLLQRSDKTTAFSKKLMTEIDSSNNLKILSKKIQDERIRMDELREKSETMIVNANYKLVSSS